MEQIFLSFLLLPLFLIVCFLTFVIPGLFLLHLLKIKENSYILAAAIGVSLFLLLIYSFSWIQLHYIPLVILILINLYYFIKQRKKGSLTFGIDDKVTYFIIAVGSLLFAGLTWLSGLEIYTSTYFFGINASDGIVHAARIKNMLLTFPPNHPALSGISFNGYHFFYDMLLASFVRFFHFSVEDLYFRYFSLFSAVFYGLSFLYFVKQVTKEKAKINLVLFFAYFSAGFASFFQLFDSEFSAGLAQPILLIFDPSVLLSIGLLLILFTLIKECSKSWKYAVLAGLILGILSMVKVYAGLIGIVVLVSFSTYSLIKMDRKVLMSLFIANALAAFLTVITYFPNNIGVGTLFFDPLRFYSHFVQQEFFSFLQWENRRLTYIQSSNFVLVAILYFLSVILYWGIALGLKVIFLLYSRELFQKSFWRNEFYVMLVFALIFSFTIGSFFLQPIAAFDIGQFFWIGVVLLSIPSGLLLGRIFILYKRLGRGLLYIFILISGVQVTQVYFSQHTSNQTYSLAKSEKRVYTTVTSKTRSEDYIIVLPRLIKNEDKKYILNPHPSSLVAAMTGRSTYFENEKIDYPLEDIYKTRTKNLFAMHEALKTCNQNAFLENLQRTGSPYLVTLFDSPCLATHSGLLMIERSDGAVFYLLQEKKM